MAGVGSMSETANGNLAAAVDLNYEPVRATDAVRTRQVNLPPENLTNLDGDLEFKLPHYDKFYRQLTSCRLYIQARVVRGDGSAIEEAVDSVTPINFMGPSLFSECLLEVQGEPCSELSATNFPYKNFFENLLSFGRESLDTNLRLLGFRMDTPEYCRFIAEDNEGASDRRNIIKNSQRWEVIMPLLNDLLRSPQELYPATDMKIRFIRTPPRFYFMCDEGDIDRGYRVKIDEAVLTLNYIENRDDILRAHEQLLKTKGLKMHMTRTQIRNYDLNVGFTRKRLKIQEGVALPQVMIIGLVASTAFNGSWTENPFFFHHYNLREGYIDVNGEILPKRKYMPKFEGQNPLYWRDYVEFLAALGAYFNKDVNCLVTPEAYANGTFLMAFDLTSDRCSNYHHHDKEAGCIWLELEFRHALPENVTVVIYSIYNAHVVLQDQEKPRLVIA